MPFIGKALARLMLAMFCGIEREPKNDEEDKEPKCSNPRDAERWPLCHANARTTDKHHRVWGPECPIHGPYSQEM